MPLAESVVKLTSVCMVCFGDASFTKRKGTEKEVGTLLQVHKYHLERNSWLDLDKQTLQTCFSNFAF